MAARLGCQASRTRVPRPRGGCRQHGAVAFDWAKHKRHRRASTAFRSRRGRMARSGRPRSPNRGSGCPSCADSGPQAGSSIGPISTGQARPARRRPGCDRRNLIIAPRDACPARAWDLEGRTPPSTVTCRRGVDLVQETAPVAPGMSSGASRAGNPIPPHTSRLVMPLSRHYPRDVRASAAMIGLAESQFPTEVSWTQTSAPSRASRTSCRSASLPPIWAR